MRAANSVDEALAAASLYSDEVDYRLVRLPPAAITVAAGVLAEVGAPFAALLVDKDEVTLMIDADALEDFGPRLRDHIASESAYRLITFDVELAPTLTGFVATISRALADADISILAFAAFSRNHFFVPAADFDRAMTTLQQLQRNVK